MTMLEPEPKCPDDELAAHAAFLKRLLTGIVGDDHLADDLVQETFVRAIEFGDRRRGRLASWLAGIARNVAWKARRSEARRRRHEAVAGERPPIAPEDPAKLVERVEAQQRVVRTLHALPEPYRSTLLLRYLDDRSCEEIATAQGVAASTVRTRVKRGLALLRERLDRESGGRRNWIAPLLPDPRHPPLPRVGHIVARQVSRLISAGGIAMAGHKVLIGVIVVLAVGATTLVELTPPASPPVPAAPGAPPAPVSLARSSGARTGSPTGPSAVGKVVTTSRGDGSKGKVVEEKAGPARSGTFSFHYQQGYSFREGKVVPAAQGDIAFSSCAGGISSITFTAIGGGKITNLSALSGGLPSPLFSKALLVAFVRALPDRVSMQKHADGDDQEPTEDVFLLHTREGFWVKLAIVKRSDSGAWTKELATVEYVLNPDAPVFGKAQDAIEKAGFVVDRQVLEERSATEAKRRAALAAKRAAILRRRLDGLDREASSLRASLGGGAGAHVAGVLVRRYAETLDKDKAYAASTFSFKKATRDDVKATRTDWDFVVESTNGGLVFDVRTVTDDRSVIRDLGRVEFDSAAEAEITPAAGKTRVRVFVGDVYVIHTLDSDSDTWALLKVLRVTKDQSVVFRWELLHDPGKLRDALTPPSAVLSSPYARIQLRGGAGGGNPRRAFLDGTKNAYVDSRSAQPLDMTGPISINERARAYVDGGYVPAGKAFLIDSVEYTARTDGDSNGPGGFTLRVGPFRLVQIEPERSPESGKYRILTIDGGASEITKDDFPVRGAISTNIYIRRDEEKYVFVEIENSSYADVVLRGRFVDASSAPPSLIGSRWRDEQYRLDALATDADADAAIRGMASLGAGVLPWLEAVSSFDPTGEYGRRVRAAISLLKR